jgi:hypothetical protein
MYYNYPYDILPRSKKIAKENNLTIKPSNDNKHKIDVYKKNKFITSVGALGYEDYPQYLQMEADGKKPKGYADSRKKLYKIRHEKDLKTVRGKLANLILWS